MFYLNIRCYVIMGRHTCQNKACGKSFKIGWVLEGAGYWEDKALCEDCKSEIDSIRGFPGNTGGRRRPEFFCTHCNSIRMKKIGGIPINSSNPQRDSRYCMCLNSRPPASEELVTQRPQWEKCWYCANLVPYTVDGNVCISCYHELSSQEHYETY